MPQLNAALVPGPGRVVVRLTGDADLSTAPLVTDALVQAAALGTASVVVDVGAARFWDCSCLHALAGATAQLTAAGRACRVVGANAATRRLVRAAALGERLVLDGPLSEPAEPPAPNVVADVPGDHRPAPLPVGARAGRQLVGARPPR